MSEWLLIALMFSGSSTGLLAVVYLAFLFIICLYRPGRVRSRVLFRWACTFFALAVVAQPVFLGILMSLGVSVQLRGLREPELMWLLGTCVGPALIAQSLSSWILAWRF
jgi:hypothetical protein